MHRIKRQLKTIPWVYYFYRALKYFYFSIKSFNSPFMSCFPAGHYYSCIPDINQVMDKSDILFNNDLKRIPGIYLREEEQLQLLNLFSRYYGEIPFTDYYVNSNRYYYQNDYYHYGDAIILYSFLRHYSPNTVIEIGSGFSSGAMMDTNDLFLDNKTSFIFIEPYPDRLTSIISSSQGNKGNNIRILKNKVQDVPLDLFLGLAEDDILFVDSSHVVKIGSDVNHILFNIIPLLNPGVIIHFHDVYWPFEYPKEWLLEGRAWNEAYFLRTFLQFNIAFEIVYFNSFIAKYYSEVLRENMPLCLKHPGSGLWIRKIR